MRLSTRRLLLTEEERQGEITYEDFRQAGSWERVFDDGGGPDHPLAVEIGLGKDTHILEQALAHPERRYVGFEYTRKKLDKVLRKIGQRAPVPNLRVVHADVIRSFSAFFEPESLAHLYVFFPDPWPKKRHHHRRILNPDFVRTIAGRLKPDAPFEVRTDNVEYVEQITEVLAGESLIENTVAPAAYLPDPIPLDPSDPESHLPTLFESKFRKQGLPIHYFYYRKRG